MPKYSELFYELEEFSEKSWQFGNPLILNSHVDGNLDLIASARYFEDTKFGMLNGDWTVHPSMLVASSSTQGRIAILNMTKLHGLYKDLQLSARINGSSVNSLIDKVILVGDPNLSNYYHFLIDILPRVLFCIKHFPDYTVLLPASALQYKFAVELLNIYRLFTQNIRFVSTPVLVRNPVCIYNMPYSDRIGLLRSSLSDGLLPNMLIGNEERRRVYVDRGANATRQGSLSPKIVDLICGNGFVTVDFSKYTVSEQILIASRSSCLIGLHGAGLVNSIFMDSAKSPIVVDLIPATHPAFEICAVSTALGIHYQRIIMKYGTDNFLDFAQQEPLIEPLIELLLSRP